MPNLERILSALDVLVHGMPPPPVSVIPLSRAQLCVEPDCSAVFSGAEARSCPACGSESVPVWRPTEMLSSGRVVEFRRSLSQRGREAFLERLGRQAVSRG